VADPTADQLKMLVKGGYAMPDGSYYIRNGSVDDLHNAILAVGRATPNAGESDVARRNSVRRHIIKRANAKDINRPDMIPDTWNPDGSLKHHDLTSYLQHYGVMGMKWGHRRGTSGGSSSAPSPPTRHQVKIEKKADLKGRQAEVHGKLAVEALRRRQDLEKNGINSKTFKDAYGKDADLPERNFYFKYGVTKMQAASEGHAMLTRTANYHAKKSARLGAKSEKLQAKIGHVDDDGANYDALSEDEFLVHYGVLGMRWGTRKAGSSARTSTAPEAARAHELHVKAIKQGVHTLSNEELGAVNNRLSLETNYSRLTGGGESNVKRGKQIVKGLIGGTKATLDAVETGKRVYDQITEVQKVVKKK
jgi:hypothetical protein